MNKDKDRTCMECVDCIGCKEIEKAEEECREDNGFYGHMKPPKLKGMVRDMKRMKTMKMRGM